MAATIDVVREEDLDDLLPLVQAYCLFYGKAPSEDALRGLSLILIEDPINEGTQLLARDLRGRAIGFCTIFFSWETTSARRLGVMNDLYVAEHARGSGVADRLIAAAADAARARGCGGLSWVTAPDNLRAQAVYDRTGAARSTWIEYGLDL